MKLAFFGSSLVSAYWNGAATYYRGIIRALHDRGHSVTFYEPDAFERQQHRDMNDPAWARVVVYPAREDGLGEALEDAKDSDVLVKASGVGVLDDFLESEILKHKNSSNSVLFWDVDAPATLERLERNPGDPFASLVPRYDAILTYGGGQPVVNAYRGWGARTCVPVYNALDPATHHPAPPDSHFSGHLGFLGNRLPDRERRVESFFFEPAAQLPGLDFVMGGAGWGDKPMPENVRYLGHVYTEDHNTFNSTLRAVLNISRDSMARVGYSPATRIFEAAGAGACIITDFWEGIELFLEPGTEILVARDGEEVADHLRHLSWERARRIGAAARRRVLGEHTYRHRVDLLDQVLAGMSVPREAAAP